MEMDGQKDKLIDGGLEGKPFDGGCALGSSSWHPPVWAQASRSSHGAVKHAELSLGTENSTFGLDTFWLWVWGSMQVIPSKKGKFQ